MATDYDAPRGQGADSEDGVEAIEEVKAAQAARASQLPNLDDDTGAEAHELPGADLSDESLTIKVVPRADNEFTCTRCFLVHHHSARSAPGSSVCRDCE